jgi:hypothetical protein
VHKTIYPNNFVTVLATTTWTQIAQQNKIKPRVNVRFDELLETIYKHLTIMFLGAGHIKFINIHLLYQ